MNLKCRINNVDYENVSQGESFSDEFNIVSIEIILFTLHNPISAEYNFLLVGRLRYFRYTILLFQHQNG